MQQRIVFLGDSITDGFSYPLLFRQALREANKPVPTCINAGVGGDTADGMRRRLDRDVLVHAPTLVTLNAGVNDVHHGVPLEEFQADVRAILERMKQQNVPMVILTTSILRREGKGRVNDESLGGYNEILRNLAGEFGHPVAEVNQLMRQAREGGAQLIEADNIHPNYAGHRLIARAVLDALGHRKTPVPEQMDVQPLAGLVRTWKIKALTEADARPLDEAEAASLEIDGTWHTLTLPEGRLQEHWWGDQVRRRGFALSLRELAGESKKYLGCATVSAERPGKVYFNTGGQLQTIWLNGRCIYRVGTEWTGYHAGKERLPAELKAGDNLVVIETGPQFFLSITDNNDW